MDKQTSELFLSAKTTISEQQEALIKSAGVIEDLNKYKLAFDIAVALSDKDQVDPADFQDTFQTLLEKSSEDLNERAKVLSVVDIRKDLNLGVLDQRENKVAASRSDADSKSPTPHSIESTEMGRRLIEHTLSEG